MKWPFHKQKHRQLRFGRASRPGMHPTRDWFFGLTSAAIVFIGAVAMIAYDFRVQFVLPPEASDIHAVDIRYSERDVRFYAERFEKRDAEFARIRGLAPSVQQTIQVSPKTPDDSESLADEESGEYTSPTLTQ